MRKLILMFLFLISGAVHAADTATQNFDGSCGTVTFRVSMIYTDTPGVRKYVVSAVRANGSTQRLYTGEEGGRFQGACLTSKKGVPLFVFRTYCRTGNCANQKYGAIEATKDLEMVLRPRPGNIANDKALAGLLGGPVTDLGLTSKFFCCRD